VALPDGQKSSKEQNISVILRELIIVGDLVKLMLYNNLSIFNLPFFYSLKAPLLIKFTLF
jgi:hypothetical protein